METLIIKSIHEHGFGFAYLQSTHDEVFLPKKILEGAGITWLKSADIIVGKVIPNFKDKLDGGCKWVCTEITNEDPPLIVNPAFFAIEQTLPTIQPVIQPISVKYVEEIEALEDCQEITRAIKKANEAELRDIIFKSLKKYDPSLHHILFFVVTRPCLPVRVYNHLLKAMDTFPNEFYNIDLLSHTPASLHRIPNFGRGSIKAVEWHLGNFDLKLGTPLDEIKSMAMKSINNYTYNKLKHVWEGE